MAASSITDICNMALTQIGVDLISDVSEDSFEARMCNARYEDTRDACLRAHPWNFATKYTTLAKTVNAPAWRWSYEYQLPAAYIRVLEMYDLGDQFEIVAGNLLYSNYDSPLKLKYTAKITDPSKMDESFKQAWATFLAAELALSISKDENRSKFLYDTFERKMSDARFYESVEKGPEQFHVGAYIRARQNGASEVPTQIDY